ncbi:MAG: preprotein translocase subunit SecA [Deltaproteobacteria bacterium CG11_big_fil_rev_8_21_14_0_20_45_16]|nr:MAG: preprotein translocase subunit SecA [Deltaproteobacteria bacterium CG11_big_fil_rev_8_21_14_0_20_45_16]
MIERLKKLFGSSNDREIRRMTPLVRHINELEETVKRLSDEQLAAKTPEFRERIKKGEGLDNILPEAFACVREASVRKLGMRHYDVQMIGGVVLQKGKIAEMKTGEGKTLVATLPLYLNALAGKGAHLVTVNDYLASRDADWMRPIYEFMGLSVGVIVHGLSDEQRKQAYACDITYGTNNEFGFDYLRDNMKVTPNSLVQRDLHYAIVDEVDSILIDEARTPLIISGPVNQTTDKYVIVNRIIPFLKRDVHYTLDEKARQVLLTDEGVEEVQTRLGVSNLYDPQFIDFLHHVDQALRAHTLFKRDVDYVVKDGEVIIVDDFTGRLSPGRRFSDGLHQALEAKEGVQVANENQTLASITYQNYFRMYEKLSGMTGTADTEAEEFASIYKLEVTVVPTHRPMVRLDEPDVIYKTEKAKLKAIIKDIRERHEKGQPVLVGTTSIEKSERLSDLLKREGIQHVVLNAKQHEREAHIIAEAGRKSAVTISTSMAGRGTDIKLGEGVLDLGGLYILGSERHESRRIDNQLRGRSGRQGDAGESRFYLSLEDSLLRIFGGDRMLKLMDFFGMEEDEPIQERMISGAIEDAQTRVEARNFDIRKHLLKYDDVMNYQRKVVYAWRKKLLFREDVKDEIHKIAEEMLGLICEENIPNKSKAEKWDWKEIHEALVGLSDDQYGLERVQSELEQRIGEIHNENDFYEYLVKHWESLYNKREQELSPTILRRLERMLLLHTLDDRWKEHLLDMDHLREGINLRGYAQKDPVLDYQLESFRLFESMFINVKQEFLEKLHRVQIQMQPGESSEQDAESRRHEIERRIEAEQKARAERARKLNFVSSSSTSPREAKPAETFKREAKKVGRNDPCPCGSGKKYKKCHGAAQLSG